MYIKLPDNFSYIVKGRRYAVVENDTLYIFAIGNISWEKMVYEMSYEIHGSNTCKYCGRKNCKDMTLDHKFAISQGGVSIPDNLVPVCQKCNIRKSYMNYEQYKKYLSKSQNQREVYKEGIDKEIEQIRYEKGFNLPKNWITMMDISEIISRDATEWYNTLKKYKKLQRFIKAYGNAPRPIIISKNNFLLQGNSLYLAEKDSGFKYVPTVKCENVIVDS